MPLSRPARRRRQRKRPASSPSPVPACSDNNRGNRTGPGFVPPPFCSRDIILLQTREQKRSRYGRKSLKRLSFRKPAVPGLPDGLSPGDISAKTGATARWWRCMDAGPMRLFFCPDLAAFLQPLRFKRPEGIHSGCQAGGILFNGSSRNSQRLQPVINQKITAYFPWKDSVNFVFG